MAKSRGCAPPSSPLRGDERGPITTRFLLWSGTARPCARRRRRIARRQRCSYAWRRPHVVAVKRLVRGRSAGFKLRLGPQHSRAAGRPRAAAPSPVRAGRPRQPRSRPRARSLSAARRAARRPGQWAQPRRSRRTARARQAAPAPQATPPWHRKRDGRWARRGGTQDTSDASDCFGRIYGLSPKVRRTTKNQIHKCDCP